MQDMLKFLQNQRLLTIATTDLSHKPWIANVYFSCDKDFNLFFVSSPNTNHSKHIAEHSEIAFSSVWFDPLDMSNRKSVQGTGICKRLDNPTTIISFLNNHYKFFPGWKQFITYENMLKKAFDSRPYLIIPSYIKFWNDELYGEEGTREFKF